MKTGRLSDAVYGRSVHKKLKKLPETIIHGAAGDDCAMFALADNCLAGTFSRQIVYGGAHCGKYGVYAAVNLAAAKSCEYSGVSGCVDGRLSGSLSGSLPGGRSVALLLSLLLPADAQESLLQQIVEEAREAGEACGVPVADVTASVTAAVKQPVLTVTAVGAVSAVGLMGTPAAAASVAAGIQPLASLPKASGSGIKSRARAGMDVVMTKWAGLEGSAILADVCREQLLTRYPAYLVDDAAAFDGLLSVLPEAQIVQDVMRTQAAANMEICAVCVAAEGGIFRALWTLGTQAGVGLEIMLKKIPIRQETVEICNHLDLNPYELASNGSLLLIASQGEALVQELEKAGIPAAVIGMVTDNNDRVIVNGEERRFLEPAKADEIFKVTEI